MSDAPDGSLRRLVHPTLLHEAFLVLAAELGHLLVIARAPPRGAHGPPPTPPHTHTLGVDGAQIRPTSVHTRAPHVWPGDTTLSKSFCGFWQSVISSIHVLHFRCRTLMCFHCGGGMTEGGRQEEVLP